MRMIPTRLVLVLFLAPGLALLSWLGMPSLGHPATRRNRIETGAVMRAALWT